MAEKLKTRQELAAMDKDALATYAVEEFGISLDKRKSVEGMLEIFAESGGEFATEGDAPKLPGAPPATPPATDPAGAKPPQADTDLEEGDDAPDNPKPARKGEEIALLEKEPRYWVTIHAGAGPGGNKDVVVGVNGVVLQIQRNKRVKLPRSYIHVLENAIETVYERDENDKMVARDVPRFGHTVHGPVED
jgi:hypothetical protein